MYSPKFVTLCFPFYWFNENRLFFRINLVQTPQEFWLVHFYHIKSSINNQGKIFEISQIVAIVMDQNWISLKSKKSCNILKLLKQCNLLRGINKKTVRKEEISICLFPTTLHMFSSQ